MKKIGVTGTESKLSFKQAIKFVAHTPLSYSIDLECHHGMCIGADEYIGNYLYELGSRVVGHPGVTKSGKIWNRGKCNVHETRESKYFLDRNKDIVNETDELWAFPKEMEEILRSGTWATIRYALKMSKKVTIFWPNGDVTVYNENQK